MVKNIKEKWKEFDNKKKTYLYISIDTAFFIMGSFMMFIGLYTPICGISTNEVRATIGSSCITVWFLLFPAMSRKDKDKLITNIATHSIGMVVVLFIVLLMGKYFFSNMKNGSVLCDILFCLGGVSVISYLLYVLVEVFKTSFYGIQKLVKIILPSIEDKQRGLKVVLEGITAAIASITALVVGIIAMITGISSIIKLMGS